METVLMLIIFPGPLCYATVAKERTEKFRHEQDSTPDLCDASAVLYQLSYLGNLKPFIMWVYVKPEDSAYVRSN